MLQRWREAEGEAATPEELLFVLERLKMGEMAADGILTVGGDIVEMAIRVHLRIAWNYIFTFQTQCSASHLIISRFPDFLYSLHD